MARPVNWRVRVVRSSDTWVDVSAVSAIDAEKQASTLRGVISIYPNSAIRGDEAARPELPEGVRE